jgi:hypothetical protein
LVNSKHGTRRSKVSTPIQVSVVQCTDTVGKIKTISVPLIHGKLNNCVF